MPESTSAAEATAVQVPTATPATATAVVGRREIERVSLNAAAYEE
jgi:hypothetical protein